MTHHETTAALQRRIAKAESERDMARAAGTQEQYLSACVLIEALDLQLAMHLQAPIDGAGYAPQRATLSTSRSDPAPAPSADAPVADAPGDREAVMAEFGITFNGRDYEYRRYRYGSLADAVAYAKLRRDEPPGCWRGDRLAAFRIREGSHLQQRTLMAELDISFSGSIYRFAGFRYDHLADAVHYARGSP